MKRNAQMIAIGNFFFRYRNRLFPVIMVGLFLLAVPPSEIFESTLLEHMKDIVALLIAFAGLAMRGTVIGYAYIKRGGLNKKVYAENLVTEGLFGICRNPLYVGNVLIYAGVFLMHGNPLVILLGNAAFLFIYQCIILAEEQYLEDKFGEGYNRYCAEVPRWIPKFSLFREATDGMRFNFRRVILKDYPTIATTIVTLAVLEEYEYLSLSSPWTNAGYEMLLAAIAVSAVVMAITVRYFKKRGILTESGAKSS